MMRILTVLLILALSTPAWGAKTVFNNGNPATGQRGTIVTAEFLNATNNHRHDGQATDGSGVNDYYLDTGAVNTLAIAPNPALTAHVAGLPLYVKVGHTNTGACTVAVNGLAAVAIKNRDGSALIANQLRQGQVILLAYDGTYYQHVTNTADYAALSGSTGQVFRVANPVGNNDAVPLGYGDGRYEPKRALATGSSLYKRMIDRSVDGDVTPYVSEGAYVVPWWTTGTSESGIITVPANVTKLRVNVALGLSWWTFTDTDWNPFTVELRVVHVAQVSPLIEVAQSAFYRMPGPSGVSNVYNHTMVFTSKVFSVQAGQTFRIELSGVPNWTGNKYFHLRTSEPYTFCELEFL